MTPTEQDIDRLVRAYHTLSSQPDYNDIVRLTNGAKLLACTLWTYSNDLAELYKNKNAAEFRRKALYETGRAALIAQGHPASKADAQARADCEQAMNEEFEADAEYKAAALRYDAAQNVLRTMQQHLSTLKAEKSYEIAKS